MKKRTGDASKGECQGQAKTIEAGAKVLEKKEQLLFRKKKKKILIMTMNHQVIAWND